MLLEVVASETFVGIQCFALPDFLLEVVNAVLVNIFLIVEFDCFVGKLIPLGSRTGLTQKLPVVLKSAVHQLPTAFDLQQFFIDALQLLLSFEHTNPAAVLFLYQNLGSEQSFLLLELRIQQLLFEMAV